MSAAIVPASPPDSPPEITDILNSPDQQVPEDISHRQQQDQRVPESAQYSRWKLTSLHSSSVRRTRPTRVLLARWNPRIWRRTSPREDPTYVPLLLSSLRKTSPRPLLSQGVRDGRSATRSVHRQPRHTNRSVGYYGRRRASLSSR